MMKTKDVDKKVNRAKPLFSLNHCRRQLSIAIIILILLSTISTLFIPLIGANSQVNNPVEIPSPPEDTSSPSQILKENNNPTSEASEPDDDEDDKSLSGVVDTPKNPINNKAADDEADDETDDESLSSVVDTPKNSINNNATNANNANNANNSLNMNNPFIFQETNDTDDENTVKQINSKLGNISKDQEISVTLDKETPSTTTQVQRTTIEQIQFKARSTQANVELSVKNLKEKPLEVTIDLSLTNNSKVYEYLDIKLTSEELYIGSTAVSSMNFTFTVEKSWILNESIDKETVRMMRYHNDTWQTLDTIYVNETDDIIRYVSTTPGLSIFAVVGDTIVEESDDVIIDSANIPYWVSLSIISVLTMTLGIVLFKKRFVYNS